METLRNEKNKQSMICNFITYNHIVAFVINNAKIHNTKLYYTYLIYISVFSIWFDQNDKINSIFYICNNNRIYLSNE